MDIVMPKMGESVSEGTIIKWHKKVGDVVKQDEIIFEISTDKVDTEIPVSASGVISEILVQEGETVEVGTIVARIKTNNDQANVAPEPVSKPNTVLEEMVEQLIEKKEELNPAESQGSSAQIIEIAMPKMGESVMEGTIIKWNKKVGDLIKKDENIFEISTDKVDTEIPSPENGTLVEILVGEQETVEVGTIVAKLSVGSNVKVQVEEKAENNSNKVNEVESMHDNFSKIVETKSNEKGTGLEFYSPLVLSIAQKENVSFDELKSIKGNGLDGRVTKKDILLFIENRKSKPQQKIQARNQEQEQSQIKKEKTAAPSPSFVPSTSTKVYSSAEVEKIPMDNIRQRIMDHMVLSRDTSVHVTELIEVDMTRIHNFINLKKDELMKNENAKITYMAFIADAVVKALKKYPLVNSSIDGDTILQKKFINLGIAVAIEPTGLIVPNIKGAGDRNIIGLAKAISDLANRARTKKLVPDDISNGTFTITNYGVFGTIFGTPIINQPEVAILGVGVIQKKPVVIEVDGSDTFAVRHIMALTLSHDHRLVDGMLGGLFLKYIKETLENFDQELFN
ncbi:MAG: 2-oxoglutarate dehydrogenase, E2 component, dihydrolipoamide succinyltransferase [Ignavibacteriaceae bacterium]